MAEIKDTMLTMLLRFILVVKILWIVSLFSYFVIKFYDPTKYSQYLELVDMLEDLLHTTFIFCIGILLVYLYNHLRPSKVCIEGHTKLYLYTFGILSIIGSIQHAFHKYYFSEYNELTKYL